MFSGPLQQQQPGKNRRQLSPELAENSEQLGKELPVKGREGFRLSVSGKAGEGAGSAYRKK